MPESGLSFDFTASLEKQIIELSPLQVKQDDIVALIQNILEPPVTTQCTLILGV
jgi:hypothetical protein